MAEEGALGRQVAQEISVQRRGWVLFTSPAAPLPPTLPWSPGQGYVQTFGLPPVAVEGTTSCLNCQATLTILHLALTIYWSLQIVKGSWGWHEASP